VSLVLAVVGLSVPAVVFGHLARSRIGESGDEGAGLATAGLVVGYVVLGLSVLAVVGLLVLPHMLGPGH
jgi:peptidoglycan biosynthesis protein MviN/MurJ (putative lipid II flippase)